MQPFYICCPTEDMSKHIIEISKKYGLGHNYINTLNNIPHYMRLGLSSVDNKLRHGFSGAEYANSEVTYTKYIELLKQFQKENEKVKLDFCRKVVVIDCNELSFDKIIEISNSIQDGL